MAEKLKILEMTAHHKLKSGTPILMARLAIGLQRAGHHVTCLFNGESEDFDMLRQEGVAVKVVPSDRVRVNGSTAKSILRLRSFLRRGKFDIVHAHDSQALDNLLLASVGLNLNIVVSRGFMKKLNTYNAMKYKLKKVRRIFVVSKAVQERMQESGKIGEDNKFFVFHGMLDKQAFEMTSTLREELGISPQESVIGIVTNESDIKGADFLLHAFEKILVAGSTAKLVLAGVSKAYVEKHVQNKTVLEHIYPLGFRKDIPNILKGLDLFVFTSRGEEALGLTIAEAQMAGVPVIVMKSGGSAEIVQEGVTGFVIEKANITHLQERIEWMLSHDTERVEMGEAAKKYAEVAFSMAEATRKAEEVYYSLCKNLR